MNVFRIEWLVALIAFIGMVAGTSDASKPNIVFIVADDLGWNDLGWRNPDIISPNLDKLARAGIVLNQSYVAPMCSPSRSAFMSGMFPYHTGMQHNVVGHEQGFGLPMNLTILPTQLKKSNYATHIIGKWHLGFCNWNYTPTYRGFDSFYGYLGGAEGYFDHSAESVFSHVQGLDLRNDTLPVKDKNGVYSAELYSQKAVEVIKAHDASRPMFLYMPFQSVHSPLQVPERYYPHIRNTQRRHLSGMVTAMDDAVGVVMHALEAKGILNNTVIIFTSDNGGPVYEGANNWPLRGCKTTLWEGGTRAIAFVYSRLLKKAGFTYNGLMHAVDWFPTILDIGQAPLPGYPIDGETVWSAMQENSHSPRKGFVYNINRKGPDGKPAGAIRVGDWKLILGSPGIWNNWYPVPQHDLPVRPGAKENETDVKLFNIRLDPTEHVDLASIEPDILNMMLKEYRKLEESEVPAMNPPFDPKSDPIHWGRTWSPGWC